MVNCNILVRREAVDARSAVCGASFLFLALVLFVGYYVHRAYEYAVSQIEQFSEATLYCHTSFSHHPRMPHLIDGRPLFMRRPAGCVLFDLSL